MRNLLNSLLVMLITLPCMADEVVFQGVVTDNGIFYNIYTEGATRYAKVCQCYERVENIVLLDTVTYMDDKYVVTTIDELAFSQNDWIKTIHISNSITSIGDFAFSEYSRLTEINIPNSVTSIGAMLSDLAVD